MKETLNTSKFGLMIRQDNREVRVFESKFERALGDVLTVDGAKFRVCSLEQNKAYAAAFLGTFGRTHVFSFFDYNTTNGRKA